tara:strand:- start:294 stop:443 length:150 start_codon:yes stop_codon:yes gene_type:complete
VTSSPRKQNFADIAEGLVNLKDTDALTLMVRVDANLVAAYVGLRARLPN